MNLIDKNIITDILIEKQAGFIEASGLGNEYLGLITEDVIKSMLESMNIKHKFFKGENNKYFDCNLYIDNIIYKSQIKFKYNDTDLNCLVLDYPDNKDINVLLLNYILDKIFFVLQSKDFSTFYLSQYTLKLKSENIIYDFTNIDAERIIGNFEGIILIQNEQIVYQINDEKIWSITFLKNNKLKIESSQVISETFCIKNCLSSSDSTSYFKLEDFEYNSRMKGRLIEQRNNSKLNEIFGPNTSELQPVDALHFDYLIKKILILVN